MTVHGADSFESRNVEYGESAIEIAGQRGVRVYVTVSDCLTFTYRMLSMHGDHLAIQYSYVICSIFNS
jgi:hypothetical protein